MPIATATAEVESRVNRVFILRNYGCEKLDPGLIECVDDDDQECDDNEVR